MGDDDLHSIAFSNNSQDNLGRLLNAQIMASQLYMEKESGYTPPPTNVFCHGDYSYAPNYNFSSSNCVGEEKCDRREYNLSSCFSDIVNSSGYLEDVLLEFSSKRRRLEFLFTDDDQQHFPYISEKNCSSLDFMENLDGNLDTLEHIINPGGISDMKAPDQGAMLVETYDSSSSCYKKSTRWTSDDDNGAPLCCTDPTRASGVTTDKIKKKRVTTAKVVYPFAVVKPGGFEGDATLNDINERILMPPTRPVRHPVGDFACRPMVVSPKGPGLSGKAVVAFTRLHTQGRGTITIIRTRG